MFSRYSVEVKNIGKRYRIGITPKTYNTLRETLSGIIRDPQSRLNQKMNEFNSFWALKDVSFNVEEGKAVKIFPEKKIWTH